MGSIGANRGSVLQNATQEQLRNLQRMNADNPAVLQEISNTISIREAVERQAEADRKYVVGDGNIKASEVDVSDTYYKGTVGNPRGYGNWAFFPDSARDDMDNALFISGTYSEAKNKAKQEAARRGWGRLYLGT